MQVSDRLPDPARTGVGVVLSSEWVSPSPEVTADAVIEAWRDQPWPVGLLTYALYVDTEGDLIRDYSQWTTEQASDDFSRSGHQLPVERRDHAKYRLYRGDRDEDGRTPGAIVAVRVDTDGPEVARAWVDSVFEALEQDEHLPPGGLGAFFHISTDGRQVLNYAEWISPEAHRQALAATGRGISQGPLWDKVQSTPGVRPRSVTRYRLHATLLPG
ncbi:MAG: hypothetical protein ABW000_20700 [Actinoplanes sp.]